MVGAEASHLIVSASSNLVGAAFPPSPILCRLIPTLPSSNLATASLFLRPPPGLLIPGLPSSDLPPPPLLPPRRVKGGGQVDGDVDGVGVCTCRSAQAGVLVEGISVGRFDGGGRWVVEEVR